MIHRSLRAGNLPEDRGLCAGAEDGPEYGWSRAGCNYANTVACSKCDAKWIPEDLLVPGRCPGCGADTYSLRVDRCSVCPLNELDYRRTHSSAGRLLDRVLELDFLVTNFTVGWNEVTAEEVKGLQVLRDERDKYLREQQERDKQNPPIGS